jgi:hypothetical protein
LESTEVIEKSSVPPPIRFDAGPLSGALRPPFVDFVPFPGDTDAFALEHTRDDPRAAADLDSLAAQPLEGLDADPVDETDARKLETHRTPRSKEIGAFVLEQGGPLRGDVSLEPERHPGG